MEQIESGKLALILVGPEPSRPIGKISQISVRSAPALGYYGRSTGHDSSLGLCDQTLTNM